MTSFEDISGPPAKATAAVDPRATTAKATIFFIGLGFSILSWWTAIARISVSARQANGPTLDRGRYVVRYPVFTELFLLHLSGIDERLSVTRENKRRLPIAP